ncbi:MAG: type VII toxin-antitoxin system HepT family RNase toxin [Bacillota bacterium]
MESSIIDKMIKIEEYLSELKEYKPSSYREYISTKPIKYAIERLIQLTIDLALDINNILIKSEGGYPANDYYSSFIKLVELDILDEEFAYQIAPSTGLRNRLVHEYEEINDRIVYKSIDDMHKFYSKYLKQINEYIN